MHWTSVIESQISKSDRLDLHMRHKESRNACREGSSYVNVPLHPMSARFGEEAYRTIRRMDISSENRMDVWHGEKRSMQSFTANVQLYSNKSVTNLNSTGFTFYPVHVMLINFEENVRTQ